MKMTGKVMTAVIGALAMVGAAFGSGVVSDVTARGLSPWKGMVEVKYTLGAVEASDKLITEVTLDDLETGESYAAKTFTTAPTYEAGEHTLVWNAWADGVKIVSPRVTVKVAVGREKAPEDGLYCVIDLSAGANAESYPVSYLDAVPAGGWTDEYKTTKLVLKRVKNGSFIMGENQSDSSHRVTLTKPFYIGVFEVTQKQWQLVMGSNPANSYGVGDANPVYYVPYNMIRGSSSGAQWPSSSAVDATSFIGRIRACTGLDGFDLPTEAQWEYACRAGTTTTYSYGDSANGNYMWYTSNSSSSTHPVGTKGPNPWGLYDMHGNVWEWCLDWYGTLAYGTDPKGVSSGSYRVFRGGSLGCDASGCTSSYRGYLSPSYANYYCGFRLVRTLP